MDTDIIIPNLNSPILDQVLDAVAAQEGIETVRDLLVVGRDEPGLSKSSQRTRLLDTR